MGGGEIAVLSLAVEMSPDIILLDDKKARNEAGIHAVVHNRYHQGSGVPGIDLVVSGDLPGTMAKRNLSSGRLKHMTTNVKPGVKILIYSEPLSIKRFNEYILLHP